MIAQAELAELKAEHEAMVALLRWAAGKSHRSVCLSGEDFYADDNEREGRPRFWVERSALDLATTLGLLPKPTADSETEHGE